MRYRIRYVSTDDHKCIRISRTWSRYKMSSGVGNGTWPISEVRQSRESAYALEFNLVLARAVISSERQRREVMADGPQTYVEAVLLRLGNVLIEDLWICLITLSQRCQQAINTGRPAPY